jgi:hypothetical protein
MLIKKKDETDKIKERFEILFGKELDKGADFLYAYLRARKQLLHERAVEIMANDLKPII